LSVKKSLLVSGLGDRETACGARNRAAGLRLGDLRPDRTLKVMGKGAKERIVPVVGTARTAIVRYMGQRGAGAPDEPLFLGRRGALGWRGMQQVLKRLKGSGEAPPSLAPLAVLRALIPDQMCDPYVSIVASRTAS
jgi:site-specific recombinase XerC